MSVGTKLGTTKQASAACYGMRTERLFVTMSDGVRLAVTLYRPDGGEPGERFPALLEMLPYRKDDGTVLEDLPRYSYFARRGYVGVRVDVRGTGASEGLAVDEYSAQEQRDILEIMDWLVAETWCTGSLGMWGLSYSGFNSIQTAILNPPALKAIVAVGATDDVYTDDIVYWHGSLQLESMGRWPPAMLAMNAMPGFPEYDVDSQAAIDRFEEEPWGFEWLRQQHDGPYWRRISLRPRYDSMHVPALLIGGWLDGYPDSIPRMLEKVPAPVHAIVGPWPHSWPDDARPGPAIDGRCEMLRWWDYWLKGLDTGILDDPPLAIYAQRYYPPGPGVEHIPGSWRYEEGWPVERVYEQPWYPQPNGALGLEMVAELTRKVASRPSTGTSNRYRLPHNPAELPGDQRVDDVFSMDFTTGPLEDEIEILGQPRVILHVTSSAPLANWIARLCDVAPDGSSQLVTKAVLNGAHRRSHTEPEAMPVDEAVELHLQLKFTSWIFAPGHRIRLAISNADFPSIWPAPYPVTATLMVDANHPSRLLLPICPYAERPVPAFGPPSQESDSAAAHRSPINQWHVIRDEMARSTTIYRRTRVPEYEVPGEGETIMMSSDEQRWCTVSDIDPAHAGVHAETRLTARRGADTVESQGFLEIQGDARDFHVTARRVLLKNKQVVRTKTWQEDVPRKHL